MGRLGDLENSELHSKSKGFKSVSAAPSKPRATFSRFSSEFEGLRQYYVDDGSEVPIDALRANTAENKPGYDIEVKNRTPNYPDRTHNEWDLYYGVHHRIARFKTRSETVGWFFALAIITAHKLATWLRLTGRQV